MKNFGSWDKGSSWYEILRVVDDMNDSMLWAPSSIYYTQLRFVVDINDFRLWTQGSRCFKELRAMNCSRLWITWMTLGHWFVPNWCMPCWLVFNQLVCFDFSPHTGVINKIYKPISRYTMVVIRSQLVSQLIHVQLVSLDFGPQRVINKIYNLLHHVLG